MDQLTNFADNRLLTGCIYCGGNPETRDHVPSKCLLERPYPPNLPVVGCCDDCNKSFSKDEQYFVCLIESVLCGSTDPDKIGRLSVAKTMRNSPALRARIESSRIEVDGRVAFAHDIHRVNNVMLKLARGHAAFELNQPCRTKPYHFWCGPLLTLSQEVQDAFNSVHFQQKAGEVGTRNMQRLMVTQVILQSEHDKRENMAWVMNNWIDVQDDQYRYIAIEDSGEFVIRIVVAEYFACEVAWHL